MLFRSTIKNLFDILAKPVQALGRAIAAVFDNTIAEKMANVAKTIEAFTAKFVMNEENVANLQKTFEGLLRVVQILVWPFVELGKVLWAAVQGLGRFFSETGSEGSNKLLKFTASLAEGPEALKKWLDQFHPASTVIKWFTNALDKVRETLGPKFTQAFDALSDTFQRLKASVTDLAGDVG